MIDICKNNIVYRIFIGKILKKNKLFEWIMISFCFFFVLIVKLEYM